MNKITDEQYENIVYISHPYGANKDNEEKVKEILQKLQKKYPTYLFLSPVHCFSWAYTEVDYQTGINMCLWLLEQADEMWVFGNWKNSKGCNMEIEYCKKNKITYNVNPLLKVDCKEIKGEKIHSYFSNNIN